MATNGATLAPIYNRLNSVPEYHPFTADTFSDWSMEAGDMIRISRDGTNYDSPVHSSSLTWKGQSQINVSSDGAESRESISKATKKKYSRGGSGYRNDSHIWQELLDDYNGLYSYFEVTASRMYVHFDGMYDGLSSTFEVTRSRLAADFQGKYDGLSSFFEVTRSRLAADFQGKYDGLSSYFEVTRSRLSADFQGKYDGLASHFEVTRSRFNVSLENTRTNLESSINAQAGRIDMVVEGTGPNSYIKPAKIQMGIDAASGQSKINLSADHVIVDGTLVTSKITADYIAGKIETLATLNARDINANTIKAGVNFVLPNGLYLSANGVWQVQLTQSGNNYTLTEMKLNGDTRTIGTFSRATTLTGTWSGGTYTVSASPQGASIGTTISHKGHTWSGDNCNVTIGYENPVSGASVSTGCTFSIDTTEYYHATTAYEKVNSGGDIYYKQGTAGTYYQAGTSTVVGRGDSVTAYEKVSSGGTIYCQTGNQVTYYQAGSSATYYNAGTVGKYARGDTVSGTNLGAGTTYTKQGSAGPKLYHYGSKQLYYKSGNYYYSAANADWYYVSSSTVAVQYYRAGSSGTAYAAGSTYTYYKGNGGYYTVQGSSVTVTKQGSAVSITPAQTTTAIRVNAASTFYKGNGGTKTIQGNAVSITPIAPTTAIRINATAQTMYKRYT